MSDKALFYGSKKTTYNIAYMQIASLSAYALCYADRNTRISTKDTKTAYNIAYMQIASLSAYALCYADRNTRISTKDTKTAYNIAYIQLFPAKAGHNHAGFQQYNKDTK